MALLFVVKHPSRSSPLLLYQREAFFVRARGPNLFAAVLWVFRASPLPVFASVYTA